jgi:hypothetical protein
MNLRLHWTNDAISPERLHVNKKGEFYMKKDLALPDFSQRHEPTSDNEIERILQANADQGMQPPTKGELMAAVQGKMKHWTPDKFDSVLGKAVDKQVISPGIHTRQMVAPGENFTTKALASHLKEVAASGRPPEAASPGLFQKLMNLSPQEVGFLHKSLGLSTPPGGDGKINLARHINNHLGAVAGDSPDANIVAGLAQKAAAPGAGAADLAALAGAKQYLAGMNAHELGHVAGKLGMADGLPEPFKTNASADGATPGQLVLARAAGNTGALRDQIAQRIDALAAPLAAKVDAQAAQALADKVAPVAAEMKAHLGKPDLAASDGLIQKAVGLPDAEATAVAKALGLPGAGGGGPGSDQQRIGHAIHEAALKEAKSQAAVHAEILKTMEDKGDFSALPAWLDQVKGMHEKAIAQLGHDAYGLALGGKGKDEMMQKLGESVAQTKGTVEAEQAKILSGKVNGFIQDPASALAAYGSPAEAASHLGQLLKAMTPAQVDAVASAVGVPKNVFGGTNGKVKAVLNKTAAALEGHLAKEKSAKLEALTAGAVDCTKKIFWGHAAKECGTSYDVMLAVESNGPDGVLHVYNKLKGELNLPEPMGKTPQAQALDASTRLEAVLQAKEKKHIADLQVDLGKLAFGGEGVAAGLHDKLAGYQAKLESLPEQHLVQVATALKVPAPPDAPP